MIKSGSEGTNWESFYTRVISQGGREEWEPGATEDESSMFTPIGVFVGEHKNKNGGQWADYLSYGGYEKWDPDGDNIGGNSGSEYIYATGSDGETTCFEYLKKYITNNAVICGIMANIRAESTFNTSAVNGDAHGLFQWMGGDVNRYQAVCKSAANESNTYAQITVMSQNGEVPLLDRSPDAVFKTFDFQIRYFLMDIGYINTTPYYISESGGTTPPYADIGKTLRECTDTVDGAKKAADIICRKYEKPADGAALDVECKKRGDIAAEYYEVYSNIKKASDSQGSADYPLSNPNVKHYNAKLQKNVEIVKGIPVGAVHCKCGKCNDTYVAVPVLHILQNIKAFLKTEDMPINSAYRCRQHNSSSSVQGSDNSLHLSGAAIDFRFSIVPGKTPDNIKTYLDLYEYVKTHRSSFSYNGQLINEWIYYPPEKGGEFIHIGITADNQEWSCSKDGGKTYE
jgi:hypothetical protein